MNSNETIEIREIPPLISRIYSAWYRHAKVYSRNFYSNAFPPIVEPIIMMIGIGLGLGQYISSMGHLPYIEFLAISLPVVSSMFTAAFDCTFGAFFRLYYNKVYDYMFSGPLSIGDIFIGEICWEGTKGMLFSLIIEVVFLLVGVLPLSFKLLYIPLLGGMIALMLSALSLYFISYIKNINQINYFITGFISPLFMFSDTVFPISHLPLGFQYVIEIFPLVHIVHLSRGLITHISMLSILGDILYFVVFMLIFTYLAVKRMNKVIMK